MEKTNWGESGKRGRPLDLLNSQFIANIVSIKLDTLGNVVSVGRSVLNLKENFKN
jgi:hypothetical protein